jgi:LDH2 family malate/lactate/ureidoglycolate dehydrogenase
MPGVLDYRMREKRLVEGILVADETWRQIVEAARRVGVVLDSTGQDTLP